MTVWAADKHEKIQCFLEPLTLTLAKLIKRKTT